MEVICSPCTSPCKDWQQIVDLCDHLSQCSCRGTDDRQWVGEQLAWTCRHGCDDCQRVAQAFGGGTCNTAHLDYDYYVDAECIEDARSRTDFHHHDLRKVDTRHALSENDAIEAWVSNTVSDEDGARRVHSSSEVRKQSRSLESHAQSAAADGLSPDQLHALAMERLMEMRRLRDKSW